MAEPELAARLAAAGLAPGRWGNGPGDRYAAHRHSYDKVIVCVRGSITFGLPGRAGRGAEPIAPTARRRTNGEGAGPPAGPLAQTMIRTRGSTRPPGRGAAS